MTPQFRWRRLAAIAVVLGLAIPAGPSFARATEGEDQVIPTTGAPQGPRTGMIIGQVVDATTGAPIPEAIVHMSMPRFLDTLPTTPKGRVMADGEGRFFFTDLPAGDYYLGAQSEGYPTSEYGQRRGSGQGQLLALGEGERRADVKLQMWKYAVIAGRVVDEAGEPVVGVAVRALIKGITAGRATFGTVSYLVPSVLTDDRGAFRLSNLTPGTYVVVAPSTHASIPVATMTTMDAYALRVELSSAGFFETSPLGQPRTQQVGDIALMTVSSVLIPPPPSATGRMEVYRTTYYPAATSAGAATEISLGAGEERSDVAITLRPVPAVRVSGRLVTPDGSAPPPMTIRLSGESMAGVGTASTPSALAEVGFETVTGFSDSAGRFTLLGVPPGDYLLREANRFLIRNAQQGRPAYWISQRVTVGDRDITDLTLALRPALRVEGRVEFRGAAGLQPPPQQAPVGVVVFETPFGEPGGFAGELSRDTRSFSTVAAGGRFIARAYDGRGWFVQSVKAGDVDITDRVFDLQTDTSIVVTYTDRATKVSGTVKDARGAATTATVLAFPVDRARWSGYGRTPRHLKSTLTASAGTYAFEHLPAGEYYVIAVDAADAEDWQDPQKLGAFARRASTLSVIAGDAAKTLDLVVAAIR